MGRPRSEVFGDDEVDGREPMSGDDGGAFSGVADACDADETGTGGHRVEEHRVEEHRTDPGPPEGCPPEGCPPEESPPDLTTSRETPDAAAGGGGWWAAADAAVTDAAQAAHEALLALGRARRLVRTAEGADAADEHTWRTRPAAGLDTAPDTLTALAAAAAADRAALGALLARTAGGGLADRPRLTLTDALTGALTALTDLPACRRTARCRRAACRRAPAGTCPHDLGARPGLGAPGPAPGYRPTAALARFLRARDRRCRFPGCRRPVPRGGTPRGGELDHRVRYPDGPTAAADLAGFCTGHHRGKHQAPAGPTPSPATPCSPSPPPPA
ncbi:hypothetical protein ACI8AC_18085 [Geodermatophilus sp. SYSU D00758]